MEPIVSGVGVLDKAMLVLGALEQGPRTLAELQETTGLSRATAHRLAGALEAHAMVSRDADGRYQLGTLLMVLGDVVGERFPWWQGAWSVLQQLRDATGEGVQLFVREGDRRVCVISLESRHGLRWIVPAGAVLPLDRGSAGRVLSPSPPSHPSTGESAANRRLTEAGGMGAAGELGWVESVEEREPGVASVSAPVRDADGTVVAAVSISGPLERLSRAPGERFGEPVVAAARAIEVVTGMAG